MNLKGLVAGHIDNNVFGVVGYDKLDKIAQQAGIRFVFLHDWDSSKFDHRTFAALLVEELCKSKLPGTTSNTIGSDQADELATKAGTRFTQTRKGMMVEHGADYGYFDSQHFAQLIFEEMTRA